MFFASERKPTLRLFCAFYIADALTRELPFDSALAAHFRNSFQSATLWALRMNALAGISDTLRGALSFRRREQVL